MYYKIINDRTVFSNCKTIQTNDGAWISNPSAEQIADAGWQVYTPPPVVPTPEEEPGYDQVMEAVKKMLKSSTDELSDEEALDVAALFPTWASKVQEGKEVPAGQRLWYDGRLWKVISPHTPLANWTPDVSPSLFVEVSIEEIRDITDPIPAEYPFMRGELGRWKDHIYESNIDNNVWTPDAYPAGWTLRE